METPGGALLIASMAALEELSGNAEGAANLFRRAMDVRKQTGSLNTPAGAVLLASVGSFKANQGDLKGALGVYHQAVDIRRQTNTLDTADGRKLLKGLDEVTCKLATPENPGSAAKSQKNSIASEGEDDAFRDKQADKDCPPKAGVVGDWTDCGDGPSFEDSSADEGELAPVQVGDSVPLVQVGDSVRVYSSMLGKWFEGSIVELITLRGAEAFRAEFEADGRRCQKAIRLDSEGRAWELQEVDPRGIVKDADITSRSSLCPSC